MKKIQLQVIEYQCQAMENLAAGIKKFDGTQYEVWSTLMRAVLTAKNLDSHIDSDIKPNDSKELGDWSKKNQLAKAMILLTLSEDIVKLVLACSSAGQVWQRLKEIHAQDSEACRMLVQQEFYNIRMKPGSKVSTYVAEVELIAKKLRDIGVDLKDEELISKIVSGLTMDFKNFMTNWMATPKDERKYANLLPRLLAEESLRPQEEQQVGVAMKASYNRHSNRNGKHQNAKSNKKRSIICYNCNEEGHVKRECPRLKGSANKGGQQVKSNRGDDDTNGKRYAVVAKSEHSNGQTWFLDSGASFHITKNRAWFKTYHEHQKPIPVQVGNNEYVYSMGKGSIDVSAIVDGEVLELTLQDVEYVPKISDNLISTGMLDHKGFEVLTARGEIRIIKNECTYIQGSRDQSSNMYSLDMFISGKVCVARAERSVEEWHQALGHPDINEIKNMAAKKCADQFKIVDRQPKTEKCGPCQCGKAHHVSHPCSRRERATEPLYRVHTDLVGPMEPMSVGGSRYFMLIRDEYSSYMFCYFIANKSQVLGCIKRFITEATALAQKSVKYIRSDNGSEFKNSSMSMLLESENVIQEFSAPWTPQQNGEAERANRTVLETAKTILSESGLPLELWGEAVLCAVYLRNRITNSRNHEQTPFQMFHSKVPSYAHLVPFGKEMHLLDSARGLSKFGSKTVEVYMIGYGDRLNTYRVWDPARNKVVISADVVIAKHQEVTRERNICDRPTVIFNIFPHVDSTSRGNGNHGDGQDSASREGQRVLAPNSDGGTTQVSGGTQPANGSCSAIQNAGRSETNSVAIRSVPAPSESVQVRAQPSQRRVAAGTRQVPSRGARTQVQQRGTVTGANSQSTHTRRQPTVPQGVTTVMMPTRQVILSGCAAPIVNRQPTSRAQTEPSNIPALASSTSELRQDTVALASGEQVQAKLATSRHEAGQGSKFAHIASADNCEALEPQSYKEALQCPDYKEWLEAIHVELTAHEKNGTWQVVPRQEGMREISGKWLFKIKRDASGGIERYKARFVARGFSQRAGVDYFDVYAPVVHSDSLRLLFALCAQFKLKFKQFDVATAFLSGEVEEELYVQPPEGLKIPEGHTCRLVKSLYGLKQAPKCFNNKFTEMVLKFGLHRTYSDPSVFVTRQGPLIMLALYVDDGIIFAIKEETIDELIDYLTEHFEIKTVHSSYYLGIEIEQLEDGSIFLHQNGYAHRVLEKFGFKEGRGAQAPIEVGHDLNKPATLEMEVYDCPYAELLGSLNYLATRTRPDLCYALSVLSKYTDCPRELHWKALKRVLRYVRATTSYGLYYQATDAPRLLCYTDSDYAGDQSNSKSTSGMVLFINTGPICFRSQQQPTVAISTTEAEYISASMAIRELLWVKQFLKEIRLKVDHHAMLLCDNQSAIHLVRNSSLHQKTKHIQIKWHFIREKFAEGLFEIEYVQSELQKADILTKALSVPAHISMRKLLSCVCLDESNSPRRVLE